MRKRVNRKAKRFAAVMLSVVTFMTSFPTNGGVVNAQNVDEYETETSTDQRITKKEGTQKSADTANLEDESGGEKAEQKVVKKDKLLEESENEAKENSGIAGKTQLEAENSTEEKTQLETENSTEEKTQLETENSAEERTQLEAESSAEETQLETESNTEENKKEETEGLDSEVEAKVMTLSDEYVRKDLIARFTFDDEETGFSGGGAKAEKKGNPTIVKNGKSKNALYLDGSDDWLNVVGEDGSSLLTDLEEVTISYYSKFEKNGWSVFAAPSAQKQSYPNEHYLGLLEDASSVLLERYDNIGSRPANTSITIRDNSSWRHVVIVADRQHTTLYVNGIKETIDVVPQDESQNPLQFQLSSIMKDNSVFQIGKGNWDDGEFYKGMIDEVEVYGKAMTEEEISHLEDRFQEKTSITKSVLANFSFDSEDNGLSSEYAIMTPQKNVSIVEKGVKGKALSMDNDWFTVTDKDGKSLLTGLTQMTISYYSKTGNDGGWTFFAAPDTKGQSWPDEHYIGILDKKDSVLVERYNNSGSRPATNLINQTNPEWKHVIVVLDENKTTLYIDGIESQTIESRHALPDILKDNSILQIGKANWGDGEFYKGLLDELTLYNRALTEEEVKQLFAEDKKEAEEPEECNMIAEYSFAEMSGKIENDTPVIDKTGNNNAAIIKGKGAKVLRNALVLPGGANESDAAYMEIPKEVFLGKETMTISLWLQSNMGKGDYSAMFFGTKADPKNHFPSFYWLLNPCNPGGYMKTVITNQDVDHVNTATPYQTETAVSSKQTDGSWGLYTTVIKPDSITGYFNGKRVSVAKKSIALSDFGEDIVAYVGKSTYPDRIFSGQVKDIQIYEGALSEKQIREIYETEQETYPEADIKATKVETGLTESMMIAAGEDLPHDAKITLSDGSVVNGYINWNKDISSLEPGDYEVTGSIDYFPYPLVEERADPYMLYDEESQKYYFCGSWPAYGSIQKGYDRIALRTADTLSGIAKATDHVIWKAHTNEDVLRYHIWAPELHKIGNDWYIFFAGGTRADGWDIRAFVLKCEGDKDILDAENWKEMGRFLDKEGKPFDSMTLDMTYFENKGHHYVVWADCAHDSDLMIGEIDPQKPYQLISDEITLSEPEYDWERVRIAVNEGPAVFKKNGKIYLTYSASATGDEYCVGLLEIDETKDVLNPDQWKKYKNPVLSSKDAKGEYGPGHNSFSVDENGNLVMVYHARDEKCHSNQCGYSNVDSLYDPCRNALIKYVRFTKDGQPVFSESAQTEIPEKLRTVKVSLNVGNLTVEEKAQMDLDAIELHDLDAVCGNLPLIETGKKFKNKISWKSSNEAVISNTGIVTRQEKDEKVTLTATIEVETKKEDTSLLKRIMQRNKTQKTIEKKFEVYVLAKPETPDYDAYLFAYFTGEGSANGEQIYFATSKDGLNWTALNKGNPVITSNLGECGLRDPFIMRSPEGDKFYLIATDLRIYNGKGWGAAQENGSKSIMVWESRDLVNWSDQRMVEVAPEGAGCTWAPEAFYNEETGEYMVFWSSKIPQSREVADNDNTHRVYYATTRDFYTFSEPEVWIELNNPNGDAISVIDATVIKVGDTYYRFTKNEATEPHREGMPNGKYIILEESNSLLGKWKEIDAPVINQLTGREGATSFKFNHEDKWCLLLDAFGGGGYHPLVTENISSGEFKALSRDEYSFPSTMRHGSVLNITEKEYEALLEKYTPDYEVKVQTKLPITIEKGSLEKLPKQVTYTYIRGEKTSAVEWKVESGDINQVGSTVTLSGRLTDFKEGNTSFTTEAVVVSKNLVYFVDCGIAVDENKKSEAYDNVKKAAALKNETADAFYEKEKGWGLIENSIDGKMGCYAEYGLLHERGYYGQNGRNQEVEKNVTYYVTLDAGKYELTSGHCEWWNTDPRTTQATVSYTKQDQSEYKETLYAISFDGKKYQKGQGKGVFAVDKDNTLVKITFGKSLESYVGGVVSYFAITKEVQKPDKPEQPDKPEKPGKAEDTSGSGSLGNAGNSESSDDAYSLLPNIGDSAINKVEEKQEKTPEKNRTAVNVNRSEITSNEKTDTVRTDSVVTEIEGNEVAKADSVEEAKTDTNISSDTEKSNVVQEEAQLDGKQIDSNHSMNGSKGLFSALAKHPNTILFSVGAIAGIGLVAIFSRRKKK